MAVGCGGKSKVDRREKDAALATPGSINAGRGGFHSGFGISRTDVRYLGTCRSGEPVVL